MALRGGMFCSSKMKDGLEAPANRYQQPLSSANRT
jgi:hypothetical protein